MTVGGRKAAQVNLVTRAPASHLLYIALRDGGPPTMERLGAPDQGADPRAQLTVGPIGGDHQTFFPLISPYDLNSTYLLYIIPIPSQISA